jgi:hypothetical protein
MGAFVPRSEAGDDIGAAWMLNLIAPFLICDLGEPNILPS